MPLDVEEGYFHKFLGFSPDGKRAAIVLDYTPHVFDVETGRLLVKLERHDLSALAFSNDGSRIITGTDGDDVKIWNSRNGLLVDALKQNMDSYSINTLAYSPDDRLIVTGAYGILRLWDVETGKCRKTIYGSDGFEPIDRCDVKGISFDIAGGRFVITAGRKAAVLNSNDASLVAVLDGHADSGITATFSPN